MVEWFHFCMKWLSLFILTSVILSKVSRVCDYYIKLLILWGSYSLGGALIIPYGLLHIKSPWKTARLLAGLISPVGTFLGIQCDFKGKENIHPEKAYIVVCNHQSSLDGLVALKVWKCFKRAAVIAKKELQYFGAFGLGLKLCGTVFVDRASSEEGRKAVNEAGEYARETATTLWIFPEGTRHHGAEMLPFKKGAFHMALNSGLPILPVVISEYYFLDHNRKLFDNGKIRVRILPEISTEGLPKTKESLNTLIESTRASMVQVLAELNDSLKDDKKTN